MPLRPSLMLVCLAAIAVAAPGCQMRARSTPQFAGPAEVGSPFAPASIRLHALSRVDRDPRGAPMIIAYLDVRDAWDDPTKAIGALQVQLYRAATAAAIDEQELTWDLDLSDLDLNSRLYDSVTHMYRLPLLDAPAWVLPETAREPQRIRLRLRLNTFAPNGEARLLEHDGTLSG